MDGGGSVFYRCPPLWIETKPSINLSKHILTKTAIAPVCAREEYRVLSSGSKQEGKEKHIW